MQAWWPPTKSEPRPADSFENYHPLLPTLSLPRGALASQPSDPHLTRVKRMPPKALWVNMGARGNAGMTRVKRMSCSAEPH